MTARVMSAGSRASLLFGILLIVASALSLAAHQYERFPGDLAIARWVQSISLPLFGGTMEVLSEMGNWPVAVGVTAAVVSLLWVIKRRVDAVYIVAITLGSFLINPLVKDLVDRPRPTTDLVDVTQELSSRSFPSGHVLSAATFYGLLLLYCYASGVRPRWALRIVQVFLAALILGMGFSRVYLGVHWPSDALGAYVFGGLFLVGIVWLRGHRPWGERVAAKLAIFRDG